MPRTKFFLVICILAMASLWNDPARAQSQSVTVQQKEGIGTYLADSKGMTLYYFAKDAPGKSVCTGDCLAKWPPFRAEPITPGSGLDVKDFGVLAGSDGPQATFRGYPLYYFFKDEKPGDTGGQGVNQVWYVIDPMAFPPAQ